MDQKYQLLFKAGQTAEARCWEAGYRGAWFRCKIKEISYRGEHSNALLEYFDYPDEKWAWTDLYQEPPSQSRESKEMRQLMLRPEYPPVHFKNEVSNVSSNVTIVVDGTWKAGDLVDWWCDNCYWSGKVIKLLDNGKAKIELVRPPLGEGATYEVFVKDMRPSLDWSPKFGWLVPASQDGESSRQYPQLLKPVSQGHAIGEWRRRDKQATTGSSSNSSFSTRLSGLVPPNKKWVFKTTEFIDSKEAANRSNDMLNQTASSSAHSSAKSLPALDDKRGSESKELLEQFSNIPELKEAANISNDMLNQTASSSAHSSAKSLPALDDKRGSESKELLEQFSNIPELKEAANISKGSIWSDGDSSAPIRDDASKSVGPTDMDLNYFHSPLKKFKTSGEIQFNSLEFDSLDAAILDLKEFANKIRQPKRFMECRRPLSDGVTPSWKFAKHHRTSRKN